MPAFHAKRKRIIPVGIISIILLMMVTVLWFQPADQPVVGVPVAAAKGQLLSRQALPELTAEEMLARDLALTDSRLANLMANDAADFLYAHPLTTGEARPWAAEGCRSYNCSQVTFYNYQEGGTLEAVVQLEQRRLLDVWSNPDARPGPSLRLMPELLAIAAADPRVQEVLGDVRQVGSIMVPMSTWLQDDACRFDWCVDLTFPAPDQSGRILHIVVNLHEEKVARLFYSRSRDERSRMPDEPVLAPPRPSGKPAAQDEEEVPPFTNDCYERSGWSVCWEMTANDGLEFRDATYEGDSVFDSIKISQVEAFYPAWPGGYRDEIGYDASVPAAFDTHVTDFDDGFEVRQMFTEPFDWPNCICCYRYEEIIRFFGDGSFETAFVSHGPGCEDLSIYRPFWRIDLALEGADNDQVWQWQDDQWQEVEEETDLSIFESVSPDGHALVTSDESTYRWHPIPTDPLGVDEGRLFLLQWNEDEGTGVIPTGPADTFRPPRQWLNGDPLSGEDVVIWYVAILKTKKGGPWWCMPDPEPAFNPCTAAMRAERGDRFEPAAQATETPPAETGESTTAEPASTEEAIDVVTPTAGPTGTPRPLQGETAVEIIQNAGCGSCHQIGALGESGKVGPDLSNIGAEAGERVPELSAEAYLRQSIVEPDAFIAPDCPNGACMPGIMPHNFGERLSEEQLETVVAFLLDQTGEATVPIGQDETVTPAPPVDGEDVDNESVPVAWLLGAGLLLLGAVLGGFAYTRHRAQTTDEMADSSES